MKQFFEKLMSADTIAVLGHIRPDGDCIGSCMGLYNYINDNYSDKQVDVFLQPVVDKFKFLKGMDKVYFEPTDKVYDLAISVDCSDTDRHGEFTDVFQNARDTICIDHHRSNLGFGKFCYCDPDASSACEVVCRFLDMDKISLPCAEALYLGIIHDTGVLKYSATSEQTMYTVGKLIAKGVRTQFIIDETFYKVRYNQNRLTGRALLDAKLCLKDKVIVSCITQEIFDEYEATKEDSDGIIDKLRVTEGVEVAILAYQQGENTFKFSLRSVSCIDVSAIAVAMGGGGHARAAGFSAVGPYKDTLAQVLEMIEEQMVELQL